MFRALLIVVLFAVSASAADIPDDTLLSAAASARSAGRFAAAADQYRQFALNEPDSPRAAEAHRLAILCVADWLRDSSDTDRDRIAESYESLLQEHLRVWANHATADDVRMWQGRLLEVRRDWPNAASVFLQVRPTSEHYAESLRQAAAAYGQQFQKIDARTEQGRQEQASLLASATKSLQPIITGPQNRWPNPWSDVQRDAALALAKLHLRHGAADSPYAAQLLAAALRGAPAAASTEQPSAEQDSWQSSARVLLVTALARNGKIAEAQTIAATLTVSEPQTLLDALAIVTEQLLPGDAPGTAPDDVGQLAFTLAKLMEPHADKLDAQSLARWREYRAAVLAATGDRDAARAEYAALAAASPNNGDIQERYAALLAASDSPDDWRQSLSLWKTIEARSRNGGDRWRRARQARINVLTRLGETTEAQKLDKLTRTLYPDWNASERTEQSN